MLQLADIAGGTIPHQYVWDSVSETHGTGTQIPRKENSQIKKRQMKFCEKLRELRKRRGLMREELAERLYVSRTAISKWKSGRGYLSTAFLESDCEGFLRICGRPAFQRYGSDDC